MRNESQWYLISYTEKSHSGQEVKDMLPKRSVKKHHALYQYGPSNNIMNFAIESKFLVVKILNSRVEEKLGSLISNISRFHYSSLAYANKYSYSFSKCTTERVARTVTAG